jgi:hypothetical protein
MTQYLLSMPGDEKVWDTFSPEQRQDVMAVHGKFRQLLEERGHRLVTTAGLAASSEARVVRGSLDDVSVTEGPYAETVEQVTGFYLVESDDLDDLLQVCGLIAGTGLPIEVRRTITDPAVER